MKRRNSECTHPYSEELFRYLRIYDLQGLLKEGEEYKCGIESYQVPDFNQIRFDLLNQTSEAARYSFCRQLKVPYYVIVTSEHTGLFRIYNTISETGLITYKLQAEIDNAGMIRWWRNQQSFTQKKAMYNAAERINNSILDKLLFANSLAWGVNIDGFTINSETRTVEAIIEKRICTCRNGYNVTNYDPNRYFHGTQTRSGDFPSWDILYRLASALNVPLILLTFDTGSIRRAGAAQIISVSERSGLTYLGNTAPYRNIFSDDIKKLKSWLSLKAHILN